MNRSMTRDDNRQRCQALRERIAREGGSDQLSATDLAFLQTFCETDAGIDPDPLASADTRLLDQGGAVDTSAGIQEGTIFGDPDAGRPDDAADANPAAPDPAMLKRNRR